MGMTSYQVEGTPGRELLERGRVEFDEHVLRRVWISLCGTASKWKQKNLCILT